MLPSHHHLFTLLLLLILPALSLAHIAQNNNNLPFDQGQNIQRRCVQCPLQTPTCPTCPGDQVCQFNEQTCDACASVQCASVVGSQSAGPAQLTFTNSIEVTATVAGGGGGGGLVGGGLPTTTVTVTTGAGVSSTGTGTGSIAYATGVASSASSAERRPSLPLLSSGLVLGLGALLGVAI